MQSQAFAANAYAQHTPSISSPRAIEHKAFQRVTARLVGATEDDAPFFKLAEAVHLNNRLWTALAADVLSDDNQLPDALKAQIVSLAEYSRKTGLKVLTGAAQASELIELNTIIMRGLREHEPGSAEQSDA